MALSLNDILTSLQQGVQAINNLTIKIGTVFPQLTGNSTSGPATAGTITFSSSQAAGFSLVTLSSGVTVKVPYYNQ